MITPVRGEDSTVVQSLVLAGAPNDGKLQTIADCQYEALLPVGGEAMVRYVVRALEQAPSVTGITVGGPVHELTGALADMDVNIVESGDSLLDTLFRGMEAIGNTERLLIVTSDIPLLEANDVDGFVNLCLDNSADFYYPILTRETLETFAPGTRRTYVSLIDGCYTGGNITLVKPDAVLARSDRIRDFVAARKSPLKLASLLGPLFVLRMLLRMLSVRHLETKVSRLFGVKAVAVKCPYHNIGIDVDKPDDFEFVRRVIESR